MFVGHLAAILDGGVGGSLLEEMLLNPSPMRCAGASPDGGGGGLEVGIMLERSRNRRKTREARVW